MSIRYKTTKKRIPLRRKKKSFKEKLIEDLRIAEAVARAKESKK